MRKRHSIILLAAAFGIGGTASASAAEIKVMAARAIATVLEVVRPQFEQKTGNKLTVVTAFSPELIKRATAGEKFDILAAPPPVLDRLIKAGKLKAETKTLLTSSDVGVEIRAGAPKPDISTVVAFKQTLLNAKSITYLPVPGVPQMLQRLGVADAIKSKSTVPDTDIVSELVAKGEVELGLVVITQILTTAGAELVGPLPAELKITTKFGAAISTTSTAPEAAKASLQFLRSEEAIKVIRKQGMAPLT